MVAFSRFNAIMAKMAVLMASYGSTLGGRAAALADAGGYRSRGNGLGRVMYASSGTVAQSKCLANKQRNIKANRRAHRG